MIVHELSADAVRRMTRTDLATAAEEPPSAIETFEFHGCLCGVSSFTGRPPWELHIAGDELLQILDGASRLTARVDGQESCATFGRAIWPWSPKAAGTITTRRRGSPCST
jgi:hypothetical protein